MPSNTEPITISTMIALITKLNDAVEGINSTQRATINLVQVLNSAVLDLQERVKLLESYIVLDSLTDTDI